MGENIKPIPLRGLPLIPRENWYGSILLELFFNFAKMVPEIIKIAARKLRSNSTKTEIILWNYLKGKSLGNKFLRQSPIYLFTENSGLDRYIIADFHCKEKNLVVEIDGSIHNIKETYILDREKEKLLSNKGIKVLRIENNEILHNISEVLQKIKSELT